jgi:hypothetical protein
MALDPYMNRFRPGFPQAPADAVLTEGPNAKLPVTRFNGLLDLFLQNP